MQIEEIDEHIYVHFSFYFYWKIVPQIVRKESNFADRNYLHNKIKGSK